LLFSFQFIILLRVILVYCVVKFKFFLDLFKNHVLKMCEGLKVQLHAFLTFNIWR